MRFIISRDFTLETHMFEVVPKNELYGVLSWIKPVGLKNLAKINLGRNVLKQWLKSLFLYFSQNKIHFFISFEPSIFCGTKKEPVLVYSLDKDILSTVKLRFSDRDIDIGKYLWYPDCCIKWSLKNDVFIGIKKSKHFRYLLNDVAAYESVPSEILSIKINIEILAFYKYFSGSFLTWRPCSYDCQKSYDKLQVLEAYIKHHDPLYYQSLLVRSKKLCIFFDKSNWCSLEKKSTDIYQISEIFEWIFSNDEMWGSFKNSETFTLHEGELSLFDKYWKNVKKYIQGTDFFTLDFS